MRGAWPYNSRFMWIASRMCTQQQIAFLCSLSSSFFILYCYSSIFIYLSTYLFIYYIYIYIYIYKFIYIFILFSSGFFFTLKKITNSHHDATQLARISLTLSHNPSVSSIAPGMSSRLHLVSTQSCCILVLAGRPTFAHHCEEVNGKTLLLSSSLLLQLCSACLVRFTLIAFKMGGR